MVDFQKLNKEADMVIKALTTYGGSFEKHLAEAMIYADIENLTKIRIYFSDIWDKGLDLYNASQNNNKPQENANDNNN